jgi:hypothetical protein
MARHDILHITNDQNTADLIYRAKLPGECLPWLDNLMIGPVVSDSLENLSRARTRFLVEDGWGDEKNITAFFAHRDSLMRDFHRYDEIVLWFDHDIRDQLQILQILNWFSQQLLGTVKLSFIFVSHFPGVHPFKGLESLKPAHIKKLFPIRPEISRYHFEAAEMAWDAVTHETPQELQRVARKDLSVVPFLKDALIRLLEEYPAQSNGLSRTEQQILDTVYAGYNKFKTIFEMIGRKESIRFLDEIVFWQLIARMSMVERPLLFTDAEPEWFRTTNLNKLKRSKIRLTALGKEVLYGRQDWLQISGVNKWIGGVHITEGKVWRRHKESKLLKRTYV